MRRSLESILFLSVMALGCNGGNSSADNTDAGDRVTGLPAYVGEGDDHSSDSYTGDSDEPDSDSYTGDSDETDSESDSGSVSFDVLTDEMPPSIECPDGEFACRGACFREVGEKHNACELVYAGQTEDPNISQLTLNDDAVFAYHAYEPDQMLRIDKQDLSVTVLAEDLGLDFMSPMVEHNGYLYVEGSYETEPDTYINGLVRMPNDGGDLEFVHDPTPDRSGITPFTIIGDYVYFYSGVFDSLEGVIRVPLAGGEPETVIPGGTIEHMMMDDTYFYLFMGFPSWRILRAPIDREATDEERPNWPLKHLSAFLMLEPDDPEHIYVMEGTYYERFPKGGGQPEVLLHEKFCSTYPVLGPEYLLFGEGMSESAYNGTYAVRRGTGDWLAVDKLFAEENGAAEDATHFYVVYDSEAIFRIAKP